MSRDNIQVKHVSVDNLLNIFNKWEQNRKNHISNIISFIGEELVAALFLHYMKSKGESLIRHNAPPYQNNGTGLSSKKLDSWFYGKTKLYQAEIKSWSVYSYGVNPLIYEKGIDNYKKLMSKWIYEQKINKVFLEMNIPIELNGLNPKPLLCFWFPINRYEKRAAFIEDEYMPEVSLKYFDIFSASNYLEEYKGKNIKLDLPDTSYRLKLLDFLLK
jgi:hypothetical protein